MLKERVEVEYRIKGLLGRMGLQLVRYVKKHAGGKMIWRYASALGNKGNIEVDLNFMYRIPFFPVQKKDSIKFAGKQVYDLLLLDIHELAAGKLAALIERRAGRDFFDASHLFSLAEIDASKLRLAFVLYAAMCAKKNMAHVTIADIGVDTVDLQNRLVPMVKTHFFGKYGNMDICADRMTVRIQAGFSHLLPFTEKELGFINSIVIGEGVRPHLITTDPGLSVLIGSHPALIWANQRYFMNL